MATARIKFTSLKMSTSSLKRIYEEKPEEFQEKIKVKLKGVDCKDQKRLMKKRGRETKRKAWDKKKVHRVLK